LPDKTARREILEIQFRNKPLAAGLDWADLAQQTKGFSGADLMALAERSAMVALRRAWAGEPLEIVPPDVDAVLETMKGSV
jgi:SpoVK/Ycf46/Vps4 family AAA+-type ATPase